MEDEEYSMIFKMILIGDSGVGKTNILNRYINDTFSETTKSTVGVELGTKVEEYNNTKIKVQIWDTAGQERYRSITNAYYKGAKGSLLVYDITNPKTFENIDRWLSDLKVNGDENISVVLLGNKSDLESDRKVSTQQGKEKAEFYKLAFMETSALNGNNIEKAFSELITDVYKNHHDLFEKQAKVVINDRAINLENADENDEKIEKEKKGCCG